MSNPTELPHDFARSSGQGGPRHSCQIALPLSALDASTATLLAAWCVVVHKHTGEAELWLGTPAPVCVAVDAAGSFAALAERAAAALAEPSTDPGASPEIYFVHGAMAADAGQVAVTIVGQDLRIAYDSALFEAATARALAVQYCAVLEQALGRPEAPLRELTISAPEQADRESDDERTVGQTLVEQFRAVAAAHSDRMALHGTVTSYSYRELDAASDAVAARLRPAVGPGALVALLCAHDANAVIAILAVLKSGAVYVPLDPLQPRARLAQILTDTAPAAILCDPDLSARATDMARGCPVLSMDTDAGTSGDDPAITSADPHALAYILYTSGSTGRPKGVMQSVRNAQAHALRYASSVQMGPDDRVPLLARYNFDAAVMDLFGALLSGASLHVLTPSEQSASGLLATLAERRVTLLHCTPTLLRHLLVALDDGAAVPPVRAIVLGGEEATGADVAGMVRHFPSATVINGLGPSECTMALQHVVAEADAERAGVPVGYPVAGVEVSLVDAAGYPAEVFGELVLAGPVALGYWNQPELTAEVFGTRPDGTRYYRSGDLARRRTDGSFVFCGRRDQQVKIRGYRVEPAEVETLLRAHPTVRHAAVVADNRAGLGVRLIGYVSSPGFLTADPEELSGYLGRLLPEYAVPAQIVVLRRLPIGPTGKLDRSQLAAQLEAEPDHDSAPRRPLELRLAGIWCEVLHQERAALRDHFFAGGGDSISLMDLLDRIKAEFDVDVSLPVFLSAPTLETLTKCVDHR